MGVDAIVCGLHVVDGPTSYDLLHLLHVVFYLDVLAVPAVCAVYAVVEHVALEPFSVLECDVERKLWLSFVFTDFHVPNSFYLVLVELLSRADLGLVGLEHFECEVVGLGSG